MKAIILTKSSMKAHGASGVCTTAYDLDSEKLFRFVINEEGGPITLPYNKRYECMDIVDVDVVKKCPVGPQQENVLVNPDSFRVIGQYTEGIEGVFQMLSSKQISGPKYMNDSKASLESVDMYTHSIEVVKVSHLTVEMNSNNKPVASFRMQTQLKAPLHKNYRVKDPKFEQLQERIRFKEAYLVISIPNEPFKTCGYYKLVAAIYPIETIRTVG